ncbi:hypothetical protein RINTU1_35830 [Candidatus Regiella insecticola]|uniref:Uncharacterized protein n=1 Tax=Candidatus Regiella insecticola TaxID=138073 RepID=A0A6L2ZSS3_9ENTR|nr:hypothetical protein RINTU1_35430 [Candidatus Regiella insecticola]GFN47489.1 hypothetical protein RINTU1_35830 [Candidatus Regiella insecticola]
MKKLRRENFPLPITYPCPRRLALTEAMQDWIHAAAYGI